MSGLGDFMLGAAGAAAGTIANEYQNINEEDRLIRKEDRAEHRAMNAEERANLEYRNRLEYKNKLDLKQDDAVNKAELQRIDEGTSAAIEAKREEVGMTTDAMRQRGKDTTLQTNKRKKYSEEQSLIFDRIRQKKGIPRGSSSHDLYIKGPEAERYVQVALNASAGMSAADAGKNDTLKEAMSAERPYDEPYAEAEFQELRGALLQKIGAPAAARVRVAGSKRQINQDTQLDRVVKEVNQATDFVATKIADMVPPEPKGGDTIETMMNAEIEAVTNEARKRGITDPHVQRDALSIYLKAYEARAKQALGNR